MDFGGSEEGVKDHLSRYADRSLAQGLKGFRGKVAYEYDWSLNE